MAVRNWTDEQRAAINTRDRTLLVSAAAGSGKTATLTQRIIDTVLDESTKGDICKMLIVTFTNAAVNELRAKISEAIKECSLANPADTRLEEQLLRVKDARIVTINSFCNDILRMTAEEAGLPPNYRIAEPAEAALIAKNILDGLILAAYEGELSEVCTEDEFSEVAEGLVGVKNEKELSTVFTVIYDKVSSEVLGVEVLNELSESLALSEGESVDSVPAVEYIKSKLKEMLSSCLLMMESAYGALSCEGATAKTLSVFESDIANIRRILSCEAYADLQSALSHTEDLPMSNSKVASYAWAKKIRDAYLEKRKNYADKYFALTEDDLRYLLTVVRKNTNIIYKFLAKYDQAFLEEKRKRGVVEFRDAERYALLALRDSDGGISALAKELSRKYSDIYIDEYQDVNALQAGVFEAISRVDNCFMVGDIKQSIYGFRSAKPEHFANKKKSYPALGTEGDAPCASLFMSRNFRCDKPIVDFTNGIFDRLFGFFSESIGYTASDRLAFSKIYNEGEVPTMHTPEIHIVESGKPEPAEADCDTDAPSADALLDEDMSAMRLCAEEVATLIDSLVGKERLANGKLVTPSDIAILTKSARAIEAEYTNAIEAKGYECDIAESRNFFLNEEVLLALSLLNSIDNPSRDIYLAALMTSPLFDFSFDEVLVIRRVGDKDTLFASLVAYSELHPEDEKAKRMLDTLDKYRKISEGMNVDAFIAKLYKDTGLLTLASANGGRDNLMLLYSHARRYGRSSFKGLHSFIAYINSVIENDGEFASSESTGAPDGKITILTYHRSKGLEFPIVIMTETQKRLHITDRGASARVKLAADFGFSVGVREPNGLALLKNPLSDIIELYNREKEFEESLRVLYVALTRARERLFIFGTARDAEDFVSECEENREFLSKHTVSEMQSMLKIIVSCKDSGTIVCKKREIPANSHENPIEETSEFKSPSNPQTQEEQSAVIEDFYSQLNERFSFEYPLKTAPFAPEKLAVSRLSPALFDTEEEVFDLEDLIDSSLPSVPDSLLPVAFSSASDGAMQSSSCEGKLPIFMTGINPNLSAERGIATHTFMQFCDFERLGRLSSSGEIECLIKGEFLSEEDASLVRRDEIDKFVNTALFAEIKSAKRLYREQRFNLKLPAAWFATDEAVKSELSDFHLMAQGVIDCVIERPDGTLHLIDYKTDRLSRTELNSPELARASLIKKHGLQLYYYSLAVESIFGRAPTTVGIYSMHLGEEVTLDIESFAKEKHILLNSKKDGA